MNNQEFKSVLSRAVSGEKTALELILRMYLPLINKNSYINGCIDEDLRQYILLDVIKSIRKFRI